jgi:hypothetical protein
MENPLQAARLRVAQDLPETAKAPRMQRLAGMVG